MRVDRAKNGQHIATGVGLFDGKAWKTYAPTVISEHDEYRLTQLAIREFDYENLRKAVKELHDDTWWSAWSINEIAADSLWSKVRLWAKIQKPVQPG